MGKEEFIKKAEEMGYTQELIDEIVKVPRYHSSDFPKRHPSSKKKHCLNDSV